MIMKRRLLPGSEIANTLHHGDCLEVMDRFPDKCIDLILCDLPYEMTANKWDFVIPVGPMWKHFRRMIVPRGNIVLFSQGVFTAKLIVSAEDLFRYKIVWLRNLRTGFLNAKKMPLRRYDDICVFGFSNSVFNQVRFENEGKADARIVEGGHSANYGKFAGRRMRIMDTSRLSTDVLEFDSADRSRKGKHPTEKPIDLCRHLVKMYSNEKDIVLDATMGSGTIPLAAKLEGRRYVGIEKDTHWFEHAKQRIESVHLLF